MIGIAFWNVHKNSDIDETLQKIIIQKKCDILILAEYENSTEGFCNLLSLKGKDFYTVPVIGCDRIKMMADKFIKSEPVFEQKYFTIQNFSCLGRQILVTALHLPGRMYAGEHESTALSSYIVSEIESAEERIGHMNTLVIGDFNANPFESMCIGANCFHGIPDAQEAKRGTRTVHGREYRMFYNPMWNFFGDRQKPSGTYYYSSAGIQTYFWNIFDQVMFRPQMLKSIWPDSLEIITSVKGESLITKQGLPDKKRYSDHLPIFFQIEENRIEESRIEESRIEESTIEESTIEKTTVEG